MNLDARTSPLLQRLRLFILLALTLVGTAAHATTVQRLVFPVTLRDGQTYAVVGYFYYERTYANKPLQMLFHGGTYNHRYWDMPDVDGMTHSYARYMTKKGYAVLALDMLGSGESSRPDGDLLDLRTAADAIHQVAEQMRTDKNPLGFGWNTIIGVGHSLGSASAIYAQAAYGDFAALVTTGLGHEPHAISLRSDLHERAMANSFFYLPPDERTEMFFQPSLSNRDVLNFDNANFTDPVSRGIYLTGMVQAFDPQVSRVGEVRGPVLVQLGDHDHLFPARLASEEAKWWTQATVTVQVVSDVGHSFNMHEGRQNSWTMIDLWLQNTLRK